MADMFVQLVPLLATWALVVASPGPNFVNTIHFAGRHSVDAGLRVATGVAIGTFIWATAANTVLAGLFGVAPWLVDALRFAGAMLLALLAIRIFYAAMRTSVKVGPDQSSGAIGSPIVTGLLSDLANPKAAIFWSGIMATTLPVTATTGMRIAAVLLVTVIAFTWYAFVAVAFRIERIRRVYQNNQRIMDAAAGVALIALAVSIAVT